MGYYADYDGYIKFKKEPGDDVRNAIENCFAGYAEDELSYSLDGSDKYYEDFVYETLDKTKQDCEKGEIEYRGEDGCLWRFVFINGEWIEENGFVKYTEEGVDPKNQEEFIGQIIDVFEDALGGSEVLIKDDKYDQIAEQLNQLMKNWNVYKEN